MSEQTLSLFVFGLAGLLLMSGLPIWAGLAGVGLFFAWTFSPQLFQTLPYIVHGGLDGFDLLSIPLFILVSAPIAATRASADLYEALHRWLYRLPGGLGISNLVACGIFAALCGSSPATAAAIGGVGIPEMRRRGYPASLACGLIAHGGTFGILIPPSITMILYGVATETSIGRCFIAGVVPGILLVFLSCVWLAIYIKFTKGGRAILNRERQVLSHDAHVGQEAQAAWVERYTFRQKLESLPKIAPFVIIIIGIMGSLYGGWATPSEAAAVGAVTSLAMVMVVYRVHTWKEIKSILLKALNESTMILLIMAGALLFSFVCSDLYVTQSMTKFFVDLPLGRWGIMFFINVLLLILGCFLPPAAIILMVAPMLAPVMKSLGFDLVWFSVMLTINMEVGCLTPPVGLNLYIVKGIAPDVPLKDVLVGIFPFFIIDLIVMVLLCVFPELATWLPNKMIGQAG